ncbi:MAG: hypothetical protein KA128_04910, partial [Zoogloea sp.]|nr:hypothetical protein [Zoogloea sp.]
MSMIGNPHSIHEILTQATCCTATSNFPEHAVSPCKTKRAADGGNLPLRVLASHLRGPERSVRLLAQEGRDIQ